MKDWNFKPLSDVSLGSWIPWDVLLLKYLDCFVSSSRRYFKNAWLQAKWPIFRWFYSRRGLRLPLTLRARCTQLIGHLSLSQPSAPLSSFPQRRLENPGNYAKFQLKIIWLFPNRTLVHHVSRWLHYSFPFALYRFRNSVILFLLSHVGIKGFSK